jgi:hypothetical protein
MVMSCEGRGVSLKKSDLGEKLRGINSVAMMATE